MKITRLETFLVKPRWLFLKLHTDEGLVGLGEPVVEGRALTVATAVAELEPYLVGQDPTRVMHHWQAMYKHAFYRGGPVLTSVLSSVEHALWDLAGKAAGLPVYKLLGGPLRDRIKVYKGVGGDTTEEAVRRAKEAIGLGFGATLIPTTRTTALRLTGSAAILILLGGPHDEDHCRQDCRHFRAWHAPMGQGRD